MKRIRKINANLIAGLSSAAWLLLIPGTLGKETERTPPKLNVDDTALTRQTKLATSFAPVIKKVGPSVVNIYAAKRIRQDVSPLMRDPFFRRFFGLPEEGEPGRRPPSRLEQSLGSGVIVSEDGYLLTNNHVVEGADEIKVVLQNERKEFDAKIIGRDPQTDIAVLKIEAKGLPAMTLTDSDKLEVGDVVLAIGNPFGVGQTVTMGIVGATGRGGFGIVQYEDFIQTDASINPGNSGGALVDADGRLVGINTFIISRTGGNQGIGFAVPINMARSVMDLLVREGKVTRGYLGVQLEPEITPDLAKALELSERRGALITEVVDDSPAAAAGLKPGDVIVEFNGRKVDDRRHLQLSVAQTPPGSKAELKALRDGKEKTFTLTVGEFPSSQLAGREGADEGQTADVLAGVEVSDLTPQLRRQYSVPQGVQGALVTDVEADSSAAEAGLRPGSVILEINRRPVAGANDAVRLGNGARGPSVLLRVWSNGGSRYLVIDTSKSKP
jgi:serine protease Do